GGDRMQRWKVVLALAAAAVGGAVLLGRGAARKGDPPTLGGRAVPPPAPLAPRPTPGPKIRGAADHRGPGAVRAPPRHGVSAILPAEPGSFWVMPDNGYGTKANSADFLLRVYHVTPDFKTAKGGTGAVAVGDFLQLRDPDGHIPFALTRSDRLLTGADFDIESIRKVKDGTLWFGDEFGPFLLHTDSTGKVLAA